MANCQRSSSSISSSRWSASSAAATTMSLGAHCAVGVAALALRGVASPDAVPSVVNADEADAAVDAAADAEDVAACALLAQWRAVARRRI